MTKQNHNSHTRMNCCRTFGSLAETPKFLWKNISVLWWIDRHLPQMSFWPLRGIGFAAAWHWDDAVHPCRPWAAAVAVDTACRHLPGTGMACRCCWGDIGTACADGATDAAGSVFASMDSTSVPSAVWSFAVHVAFGAAVASTIRQCQTLLRNSSAHCISIYLGSGNRCKNMFEHNQINWINKEDARVLAELCARLAHMPLIVTWNSEKAAFIQYIRGICIQSDQD